MFSDKVLDAVVDSLDYHGQEAGIEAIRQLRARLRTEEGLHTDLKVAFNEAYHRTIEAEARLADMEKQRDFAVTGLTVVERRRDQLKARYDEAIQLLALII